MMSILSDVLKKPIEWITFNLWWFVSWLSAESGICVKKMQGDELGAQLEEMPLYGGRRHCFEAQNFADWNLSK